MGLVARAFWEELPRPPEWTLDALCAQADPESWFPEVGGSAVYPKRVCRRCPVRADCLEYALEHDERFGIYGGYSEHERSQMSVERAAELVQSIRVASYAEHLVPLAQPARRRVTHMLPAGAR